ncbi:MAG TPA: hypothetical protein VFU06_06135 [Longimicrobiales bacterium]|nr:hypothetical protein [Longimicrobiales bacterium]
MRRPVPLLAGALLCALLHAGTGTAAAQEQLPFSRVEGTIIGSMGPQPLPMPASRNHNYWGFRLQAASHLGRSGADFEAIAGGVDLQWRGGSTFGVTAGYQRTACDVGECNNHLMFEGRGRFNFITGGPTIAGALGDANASTTVGFDVGLGFSPDIAPRLNACAFDIGMPVAIAMLQSVRLVVFAKPTLAWDFHCGGTSQDLTTTWIGSFGVGLQQLGLRGLDVNAGFKKLFRDDTGYVFGVSVSYLLLP